MTEGMRDIVRRSDHCTEWRQLPNSDTVATAVGRTAGLVETDWVNRRVSRRLFDRIGANLSNTAEGRFC